MSANVPREASSFVGRASDLERAMELCASESHVVTLLGPAGIGKTRLATRVAHETQKLFEETWFVAAAEARTETALVSAVGAALSVSTGDVGHAIAGRGEVLVVIDNVEQVTPSAAEVIARWSLMAPRARFLVTSRERLRIEGEACLELAPLEAADATRLFVERAAIARGRFSPDAAETKTIADLVVRLDGNPLAIELAAARTKMFSVSELLARIDKRFDLLQGGPRDRTPRQGSLRGAIDWSWELLSNDEKSALARCAVFRGGFSIEAAEAVLGARGLTLLESLVDKSLVRRNARFGLYETIRDYAREKLAELGEEDDALAKHVAFYSALAEGRAAELHGEAVLEAIATLRAEADNIVAAHARLRKSDKHAATSVALALNALLAMRGPVTMQRELLDAAVADSVDAPALHVRALTQRVRGRLIRGDTSGAGADADLAVSIATDDDAIRAFALEARARVDVERGRTDRSRIDIDAALAIYQKLGNRAAEGAALSLSAAIYIKHSQLAEAHPIFERALEIQRAIGDKPATMSLLANLGIVHHWQDRDDEAKRCYRAALDLAIELGDQREESVDRINLALLLLDENELELARAEFTRALEIQRAAGHRQYVGNTVGSLGSIDLVEGNAASARRRFEESLVIFQELGHRRYEAATHRYLGIVALEEGDFDRALIALETARAITDEVGDLKSFVLGPLGATLAMLGRTEDATHAFADARKTLETRGEPRAFVLLEIFEAFALAARGDVDGARAVLARTEGKRVASDARVARRLLSQAIARAESTGHGKASAFTIGEEARWFRVGTADKVDLSKRRAPRLILLRLVEARAKSPGHGLTLDEVIAAGWPGERIQPEAAAARAYTAIKTLRELGLGDLLVRRDDGYLIEP